MRWTARIIVMSLVLLGVAPGELAAARRGVVGRVAPALGVSSWYNLPADKKQVDVADYRGKVVYLFFFQSW